LFFEHVSDAARGPVRTFSHAAAATQKPAHLAQGANHQQEEDVQVVTHPRSPFLHSVMFSRKQCCGYGMFIPDPDFVHTGMQIPDIGSRIPDIGSRIPDPKMATKERGEEKKLFYLPFL
jgi:hypothetical protein